MRNAVLLISCPDRRGILQAITHFIAEHGGNIEHADQHIDSQLNIFFLRIEWSLKDFSIPALDIQDQFLSVARRFDMSFRCHFSDEVQRVAIFVSKPEHCLYDLLLRHRAKQFLCQIPVIISNHPLTREIAEHFEIPFYEFFMSKDNKAAQEKEQLMILKREGIQLIVLARYHQILTQEFVQHYPQRIINIHHSFLPAFIGKNPYAQAFERGVKVIGATSHYVTEALDEGPIIEQDTVRISHRDTLADLVTKGEDLERSVLSRAVRWHLEHKVLSYGNKTVVFD